ncbi:peptide ligase PGM1-related protein [Nocardioides limicola]|uniref:peptide ligase PGM1-related protein n=1 Tax=Nocardioides limicola TaxID=2803368 RepID=UPI00193B45FB|nr:peptide ligase PGM1-related protein [Nocardioides sp. DJM-14]
MVGFAELQGRLADALATNRPGSQDEHVVVGLPSYSLGPSILEHYRPLLGALEHRFLLAMLMLPRIPGEEFILVTSQPPGETLLDYYARLADPADPGAVRRRLHLLVVPDDSPRSVAAKLLDRPDLLGRLRDLVGDRLGHLEPWNVTEAEVAVAVAVGLPVNGTPPELWPLGFKSAGRQLFARAGVPTPCGREGVRDAADVAEAVTQMRRLRPRLGPVVIKQDNSGYGDGNWLMSTRDEAGHRIPRDWLAEHCLDDAPEWFVRDLALGGVVEEYLSGRRTASPSAQLEIAPGGDVHLLSTHEQIVGGPGGQTFVGCRFPADPAYSAELGRHALAVGKQFAAAGAIGRLAVDFIAVHQGGRWQVYALEVNLRKGGTTHPYAVLRNLTPGHYDPIGVGWIADQDGQPRCYYSADGLQDPQWVGLTPAQVIAAVEAADLSFDRGSGTGVVLHMLGGLAVDGRMGLVAIGRDPAEADNLAAATEAAVRALTPGRSTG